MTQPGSRRLHRGEKNESAALAPDAAATTPAYDTVSLAVGVCRHTKCPWATCTFTIECDEGSGQSAGSSWNSAEPPLLRTAMVTFSKKLEAESTMKAGA